MDLSTTPKFHIKVPVNPAKYYKEGDEVNVIAIDYDKRKRHLSLSIKDATIDPWKDIESNFENPGDTVKCDGLQYLKPYGGPS